MNRHIFISFERRCIRLGRIVSALAATVVLAASVRTSVAQNLGSIGQATSSAAPYNTVYFGIYPQTFFSTALEAMDHLPMPITPAKPFVTVSDNQKLNGGALSFGHLPEQQTSIMYVEPLKWQIVKDNAEGFQLFTDGNVDMHAYNSPAINPSWDGTWNNASIRAWLLSGFLNGHSHSSIPPVYNASLTSYPSGTPGQYNHLIGLTYPHSDLPSPPSGSTTAAWTATGDAAQTDFFTQAEKDAIAPSLLTNPTFGANPDNVTTTDMVFLPAADVVEEIYPNAAHRKSVNTRYVMSYRNTTSAPDADDWLTRTHSTAPFPGYVTQITRSTGAPGPEAAITKKPVRLSLHLNRDRILMVSHSKPAATSTSFTATSLSPSGTLKLTLVDNAIPTFTATSGVSPVDGYIPVSGSLALNCNGGKGGANSYISCLLEDKTGIRYYTKAATCTGAAATVNLNFAGVAPGTYTLKVFNEIVNSTGKPDYACKPVLFDAYMAGGTLVAPQISTVTLPDGFMGRRYSDTVKLSVPGSPAPTFVLSSGTLPPGLSLNAVTGRISGTPDTGSTGNYTFTVRVKNPAGFDEKQYSFAINEIIPPVIITTQAVLEAADSAKGYLAMQYVFRFKLKAGTGLPSVKFYKTTGNLPSGLTLDADGTLHGVPTSVETQNFTICAETEGTYDYQSYTISVLVSSANPILPVFVTKDLGSSAIVKENEPFADTTIQITGSQYIHILYAPSTFPTGIAFDPSTGKILGTPIQGTAGTYSLHLWAKNPATKPVKPTGPDSVGITYTLTVVAAGVPVITTPSVLPAAPQGQFYTARIVADRPATLQWQGGILPSGLSLDVSSGTLSG
ncbi:MAG: Ig domain-containing protein, partial [Tannerella sp.]|nr:Ig domain-containing protein [Tannerella sp.]